jgi:hypothetical protein
MKDIISYGDFLEGRNNGVPNQISIVIECERLAKALGQIEPYIVVASNSKGLGIPETMTVLARIRDGYLASNSIRLSNPASIDGGSHDLVVFEAHVQSEELVSALNESFGSSTQKLMAIVKAVELGSGDTYVSKLKQSGLTDISAKASMFSYTKLNGHKSYLFINA